MKTDMELEHAVQEELAWEADVPDARLRVAVKDGVVTLSGHLDTPVQKSAARNAAQRVAGVKYVAMELDAMPTAPRQRSDAEIATAIGHMLAWSISVPQERVQAVVEKGWVTLRGELDQNYQRLAAERAVRQLWGVVGITNRIRILETTAPATLLALTQSALLRQETVRAGKRMDTRAGGNSVALRGQKL